MNPSKDFTDKIWWRYQIHFFQKIVEINKNYRVFKTVVIEQGMPHTMYDHIVGVMVSMLASSAVDRGFQARSNKTKKYQIGICCFSAKHTSLRKKSKDWLVWNQNLYLCQSGATCLSADCGFKESNCVGLVQSRPHHHLIEN